MKFRILFITTLVSLCTIIVSCSSASDADEPITEEPTDDKSNTPENSSNTKQYCDETSDFPNLGPSASSAQSCDDASNPNNIGTLDCRTNNTIGGYENLTDGWGSYKIRGGAIRYDGTKTRVERFFKTLSRGTNKKTILSGILKIIDLSDGNTCIIQSHAGGNILKGEEAGSTNRSAQFLLYAMKTSDNKIKLENHITNNPYTTETGGARNKQEFKILDFNKAYDFVYETGYDENGAAFSKIKIGDTEKYIEHNHTTERVYSRYGAYGTSDSGDITAHLEFKDITLCRIE